MQRVTLTCPDRGLLLPTAHARSRTGLCRPAARRRLAAQLLEMAEARLRLEAFAAHHAGGAPAAAAVADSAGAAAGQVDAVLCAFVAAVRRVLRMQAGAVQVLQRQGQRPAGAQAGGAKGHQADSLGSADTSAARDACSKAAGSTAAAAAEPPLTLLDLAVSLEDLGAQLRDLSRLCRCAPVTSAAVPAAGGAATPWPAELAGWVEAWGWGPSAWQQLGFVSGMQLLDGLYWGECGSPPRPRFV